MDNQKHDAREMGPAGAAADRVEGEVVSGMPSQGHHEIGRETHEHPEGRAKLDPLGMGMDAYRSNQPRSECPYDPESEEGRRWLDGWDHQKQVEGAHPTD